ncbi:toxin glutamine deamidase domain-containing protein [Kitasatospora sp. NBC_01539]|uniref:toxin glutamine deamidase domain-containing protein n=1 Tax=Kitasatospora sp. NBC_01539 TaxID=2903577 RepID=UPI00386025B9
MLPDGVEWVLEMLGFDWPKADEDKLRECAQVWRDFADQVDDLNYRALSAANSVRSANSGDSIEAFGTAFDKFTTGGDGYLADAATAARLIAAAFEAAAVIVVVCKIAVITQLVILAAELIAAQAAAPFTFGLSEVGALGATQATKMIVRRLLKELRDALIEAIMETLKDPIVSAVQAMISDLIAQTVNQGFGAQDGYDLGRTVKTGWEEGKESAKNWDQTFTESLRDGLGSRAGGAARHHADNAAGHGDSNGGTDGNSNSNSNGNGAEGAAGGDGGGSNGSNGATGAGDSGGSGGQQGSGSGGSSGAAGSPGSSGSSGGSGSSGSSGSAGSAGSSGTPSGGSSDGPRHSGDGSTSAPHTPTSTDSSGSRSDQATTPPGGNGQTAPSASDNRNSSPLDPFGTRLPADSASGAGPMPTGGDSVPSAERSAPSGADSRSDAAGSGPAPAPAHTGTDGRSAAAPTGDAGAASGADSRSDAAGSGPAPAHTGTDGRSAAAPTGDGGTTAPGHTPDSDGRGGDRRDADGRGAEGPRQDRSGDDSRQSGPVSGHPRPDSASDPAPGPSRADDGRPAPSYGPVRQGGSDGSPTPFHSGDQGGDHGGSRSGDHGTATPAYGPVRGGDVPPQRHEPAPDAGPADRSGTAGQHAPTAQHGRPGDTSAPSPEHRAPVQEPAAASHGAADPRTVPSGGAVPAPAADHARPAASEGSHRDPRIETASVAAPAAPDTRGTGAEPAGSAPGGQQTSAPTATGPVGPGAGVPTAGGSAPTGGAPGSTARPSAGPSPSSTPTPTPGAGSVPDRSTVPGQADGRPDRTDRSEQRPTGLGQQPATGRPGVDRPEGSDPRRTSDGPVRPDQRAADGQHPASGHPDAGRPDSGRPDAAHPAPDHTGPDHDGPDHDGSDHDGRTPTGDRADSAADTGSADRTPPRSATEDRPYGGPGGLEEPSDRDRERVEDAVPRDADGKPQRHPDPEGDWPHAINGDDPAGPGRHNNCVDVALATVDTYSGHPTPAAARTPDHDAEGRPSDRGERGGRDRIENALGAKFSDLGDGPQAYRRLEDTLRRDGHGAQAVIITRDADGRAHAWNAVNHNGTVTYIDAQSGRRSDQPLHDGDNGVFAIPLDADRRPTDHGPTTDHGADHDGDHGGDHGGDRTEGRTEEQPDRAIPDDVAGTGDNLTRNDDDFRSETNYKGQRKSHLNADGDLVPANPNGAATMVDHVDGRGPIKSDSPYTSLSREGASAKDFGGNRIRIDLPQLEQDIADGKVTGVEINSPAQVQAAIQADAERIAGKPVDIRLPPGSSRDDMKALAESYGLSKTAAKRLQQRILDMQNTSRDEEWLIKGVVPHDYIEGPA